jgi:predicted RNA-binding protein with PIN domain
MKIIVDAYNLMYRMDLKATSLETKRAEMIEMIQEFLAINPAEMILVFDGGRNESNHRGHEKHGQIKVIFSAQGESADDIIEELVRTRTGKAKEHLVVSSDNRLIKYALDNHFQSMNSDAFAEYFK